MELNIRGKNVKVSEDRRELIQKKLGNLNHYLESINEATVELSSENTRKNDERLVVEMTVRTNGTLMRAEERDNNLSNALDRVHAKMQRQMSRYKDRRVDRKRRLALPTNEAVNALEPTPPPPARLDTALEERNSDYLPVKIKTFQVSPIVSDEAIEQMELLGHDFFVFLDAETKEISVVYRRDDGYYGLLRPSIAS